MDPVVVLYLGAAAIFGAIGAAVFAAPRLFKRPLQLSLVGIGPISATTTLVCGMASLIVSYHLVTHGLGLLPEFRAPLWLVFVGGAIAATASLGIDAIDNRRSELDADQPGAGRE